MEVPLSPALKAAHTDAHWLAMGSSPFARAAAPKGGHACHHPRQRLPPATVTEEQVPSGPPLVRSSHHIDQLSVSWSSERLPPRKFLDKYSVPRVVRIATTEGTSEDGSEGKKDTLGLAPRAMPVSAGSGGKLDPSVDLSKPILLYRQYRSGSVQARSLRRRGRRVSQHGHWEESGPAMAFPENYGGWFTLVSENGQQLAPCFTSIGHVASSRLHFFVTRFDLPAYKLISPHDLSPGEKGKSVYTRTMVRSGQVLRLMGVFEDAKAASGGGIASGGPEAEAMRSGRRRTDAGLSYFLQRLSSRGSNGRPRGSVPLPGARFPAASSKYAQCVTHTNEVLFVPLKSPGRFYAVTLPPPSAPRSSGGRARLRSLLSSSHSSSSSASSTVSSSSSSCSARSFSSAPSTLDPRRAFTLGQLLRSRALPVRVHLICGPLPKALPSGFTGTLLLEEWHREDVVLACTIPDDGSRCSLLEMELDSRLLLSRPSRHETRISRSPAVRSALTFCRDHAEDWRRNIKVTHHVFPGESRRRELALKECNNGPLSHQQRHEKVSNNGPQKSIPPMVYAYSGNPSWRSEVTKQGGGGVVEGEEEVPYSRVWDEVVGPDEAAEENIYAEICEPEGGEDRASGGESRYYYLRAGGGSDGTLSGTMSSSSPEDEFIYDSVC